MDKISLVIGLMCVLLCASLTGAEEFSDPMKPVNYSTATVKTDTNAANEKKKTDLWKLTAVLLSDQRSVAVVNGQSLQLGDLLEGYTLTGIYQDRVVFNGKGRKFVLKRSGTGLKKKAVQRK